MQKVIINIAEGVARMPEWRMKEPVNFQLLQNEHLAIVGPNGAGKTMLVDMLTGRHPLLGDNPRYSFAPGSSTRLSDNIKYIAFRDTYGGDNDRTYYLQQRWNQTEIDASTLTVAQKLDEAYRLAGPDTPQRQQLRQQIYRLFQLDALLNKYVILLSSGELRKLMLASCIFAAPQVLIIDNPFIGLDTETRQQLKQLLEEMAHSAQLQIVLVLSNTADIPAFITHVVPVQGRVVQPKVSLATYQQQLQPIPPHVLPADKAQAIVHMPYANPSYQVQEVVQMHNVTIRYGARTILKDLCWTILNTQCWALSGPNGAGKSTLLSLVCADNPQSYACNISLFGKKRGSGESIWDIKKHIGYVSPEMHRAYHRPLPVIDIVASGLSPRSALSVKTTAQQRPICLFWLSIFGIDNKADVSFLKLSSGQQRLVLLARAFVKDPQLLILDEPLHGLDDTNRRLVKDVINAFCSRKNKTLIMVTHYQAEYPECIQHTKTLVKNK